MSMSCLRCSRAICPCSYNVTFEHPSQQTPLNTSRPFVLSKHIRSYHPLDPPGGDAGRLLFAVCLCSSFSVRIAPSTPAWSDARRCLLPLLGRFRSFSGHPSGLWTPAGMAAPRGTFVLSSPSASTIHSCMSCWLVRACPSRELLVTHLWRFCQSVPTLFCGTFFVCFCLYPNFQFVRTRPCRYAFGACTVGLRTAGEMGDPSPLRIFSQFVPAVRGRIIGAFLSAPALCVGGRWSRPGVSHQSRPSPLVKRALSHIPKRFSGRPRDPPFWRAGIPPQKELSLVLDTF